MAKAHRKIDSLREKLSDPFYRIRDKNTNEYMLGKPRPRKPPQVLVTQDDIIRLTESVRPGTCFLPKLDEDELLTDY